MTTESSANKSILDIKAPLRVVTTRSSAERTAGWPHRPELEHD